MNVHRRQFLSNCTAGVAAGLLLSDRITLAESEEKKQAPIRKQLVDVRVSDRNSLQEVLYEQSKNGGGVVRIERPATLVCRVRTEEAHGQKSSHPLLVPDGVELDLDGSTLLLDFPSPGYGIRLSNRSAIRNGTVRVIRSNADSQAIWNSCISIGAAYGDGGTVANPNYYSKVSHWTIENMVLDQPFRAAVIAGMSEVSHGVIRNIDILDSERALIGIAFDWGTVGPITTPDELLPDMRKLWDKKQIYSTHPHDILIEDIRIGRLGRNVDPNDAGVRCAGCHKITIKDVTIESAASAVAIFGGDFGYEFALDQDRPLSHVGYVIDGVSIDRALQFGMVLNGSQDNVYRASLNHGYKPLMDPVQPGLQNALVRNVKLRGSFTPGVQRQGMFITACNAPSFENVEVEGFDVGVHVEDWVHSMKFKNGRIAGNRINVYLTGSKDPPKDVSFDKQSWDGVEG